MKKSLFIPMILVFIAISLYNCSNDDSGSEPEEVTDPDPVVNPISGQVSTYTNHVKSIIDSQCTACHGMPPTRGAPMLLTSYNAVSEAVENRDLLGRLKSTNNVMPPSGKIDDDKILLIEDWIADGLKE